MTCLMCVGLICWKLLGHVETMRDELEADILELESVWVLDSGNLAPVDGTVAWHCGIKQFTRSLGIAVIMTLFTFTPVTILQ